MKYDKDHLLKKDQSFYEYFYKTILISKKLHCFIIYVYFMIKFN